MEKIKNTEKSQGGNSENKKAVTGTRLDDLRYFESSLTRQMYKSIFRSEFSLRPTGWLYGVET